VLVAVASVSTSLAGQSLTVPSLEWRRVETQHFRVLFPREAEPWALAAASRLDAAYGAVSALVGSAPTERITAIIADPNNLSNGFALPFLDKPAIFFWPTPPSPAAGFGEDGDWGELLSVHEYAHIAHLTRPSRNAWQLRLMRWSPAKLGPLALKAPRWVVEGYATYVEGVVSGVGRPNGIWRATLLRTWAVEGELPTYAELDGSGRYQGGAMAYLVGSAFLEWLVQRAGDSSLVHLWRRMSARDDRSFESAFAGVFGAPPDELYGQFTAEVAARAMADRRAHPAEAPSLDSGRIRLVQRLYWTTGAPAVSPDGRLLALTIGSRTEPPRLVVWKTAVEAEDSATLARRREEEARDPEDVPAVRWRPPPKRPLAVLGARGGTPFTQPRFLPGGEDILVVHASGTGRGEIRQDLYVWRWRRDRLRRVTHGAGIRHADPTPDGTFAVGDRCLGGVCDLVRIDLVTGTLAVIAAGAPDVVFDRPRISSDGRWIAVAVQRAGTWRVSLLDAQGKAVRDIAAGDGANRYAPAFLSSGDSLVVVSEASGTANIEIAGIDGGRGRPVTRVGGAVLAPEPAAGDGDLYFLDLHARGLDLVRVPGDEISRDLGATPVSDADTLRTTGVDALLTVHSSRGRADTLARSPMAPSHAYGAGPREYRILPSLTAAPEGIAAGAMFASTDPVGRLTWLAQGIIGTAGTWRGASAGAAWRGWPPTLSAEVFYTEDAPSRQGGGYAASPELDATYAGAALIASLHRSFLSSSHTYRVGLSLGAVDNTRYDDDGRGLAFAEYRGSFGQSPGDWRVAERVGLYGAIGETSGEGWSRGVADVSLSAATSGIGVGVDAAYGLVERGGIPLELFAIGGTSPPLYDPALLSQRAALAALPAGVASGTTLAMWKLWLAASIFRPYFTWASAASGVGPWHRVLGVEADYAATGLWLVRLPTVRFQAGAGYSFDPPVAHRLGAYLTIVYRP